MSRQMRNHQAFVPDDGKTVFKFFCCTHIRTCRRRRILKWKYSKAEATVWRVFDSVSPSGMVRWWDSERAQQPIPDITAEDPYPTPTLKFVICRRNYEPFAINNEPKISCVPCLITMMEKGHICGTQACNLSFGDIVTSRLLYQSTLLSDTDSPEITNRWSSEVQAIFQEPSCSSPH